MLPELKELQRILSVAEGLVDLRELGVVDMDDGEHLPIYGLRVGTEDRTAPTLGLFGGVHGLEFIGSEVIVAFLQTFLELLRWDQGMQQRMKRCRFVSIPVVNPGGVQKGWRSNPRGVDLMRNAPVEADTQPAFLVGGHRLSNRLPWFRGRKGEPMEKESQALVDFVREEMFSSRAAIAVDLHSGFGAQDRLWFPYARTKATFPRIGEVMRTQDLLDRTYPNHVYQIEPQSASYTTHGDLWDYLFDAHQNEVDQENTFIPWTLEMGSWIWLRKNPRQILKSVGPFHPMTPHRTRRVLRRHLPLLSFFLRVTDNPHMWAKTASG